MKKLMILTVAPLLAVAIATQQALLLEVNGKVTQGGVVEQDGKTFVSLEALKAAGAQVSQKGNQISIQFLPIAGRDQLDAVEGMIEHWVQNDLWRVRVESITPSSNPFGRGPGLTAKVELRNLSKRAVSPFASGLDKVQIIDDKNQVLQFNQGTFKQFFKDVPPGGAIVETVGFGSQDGAVTELGKPTKVMFLFRTTGGKKAKDIRIFVEQP